MKKLFAGCIALILLLTVCISGVAAYDRPASDCTYTDSDGDGICDNRTAAGCPTGNAGHPRSHGHHGHGCRS